jgi:hypothetical protein
MERKNGGAKNGKNRSQMSEMQRDTSDKIWAEQ